MLEKDRIGIPNPRTTAIGRRETELSIAWSKLIQAMTTPKEIILLAII